MQAGALRSAVITRFVANTTPSDSCPPACAGTGLPSSRTELSERAMSLCPVPPGTAQNESAASVLVSATMARLTTGDLSVRSFEAYIRDFTFVWLIPLSSWASARRSPSAQPTFLSACRFLCRTDSFHSVNSAELRLAHHWAVSVLQLPTCGVSQEKECSRARRCREARRAISSSEKGRTRPRASS